MKNELQNVLASIRKAENKTGTELCIGKIVGTTIFEQIEEGGGKYAIYQKMADGTWQLRSRPEYEQFVPLIGTPLSCPPLPIEYESEEQLYNNVKAFIEKYLDVPNPLAYDVLTAFVFNTWLAEIFDFCPYIGFYGRESVGKTRGLEILKELCFRGWLTTNITTATLFRLTQKFSPTLLLDESEFLTSEDKKELIGLLNSGQRRGVFIPRMMGEHSEEIGFYNVYCPKAIAGTRELKGTTRSRMITFTMTRNVKAVPRTIDKYEGQKLRGQLLMWRFLKIAQMQDELTLKQKLTGKTELKATREFKELESLSGRNFELFYPLCYVAPTEEARKSIFQFAEELESAKLQTEKTELSTIIFEAIINIKDTKASHNLLLIKDIAEYINGDQSPQYWTPEKTIVRRCGQMGFEKTRVSRGTAIILNQQLIDRLRKDPRYSSELFNFEPNEANEPKKDTTRESVSEWPSP
jgi:hypothetical protein